MSAELPPLETRISRITADFLGMPTRCGRRCCRRTGHCHGATVADTGTDPLPDCLAPLAQWDRQFFADHAALAAEGADLILRNVKPPVAGNAANAYYLQIAMLTALFALGDDPAERPRIRRWRRAVRFDPRLRPPPFSLQVLYRHFGSGTAESEAAEATAMTGTAPS